MDGFLDMLPARLQDHPSTFRYLAGPGGTAIRTGPDGDRLMAGFRGAVAALAAAGNDLIVDEVWLQGEPPDYARLPAPCRVLRVGLFVALDVLEARERARGDRMPGLARAQVAEVHRGVAYDLELDGTAPPPANAGAILARLGL
jgi:chloramphenicol 3-O phosphotransferase